MNFLKVILVFCFSLIHFCSYAGQPEQAIKDRMKSDLDIIRNAFDVKYAQKEWKFTYAQWDLDQEINKAKEKIQETSPITVKAYQRIVKDFFNSTRDYHVNVFFHSTEKATLPFRVKGLNGKYFVTHIESEKLSSSIFPLTLGDEIVSFGGRPTEEVVQELLQNETNRGNEATDRYFASYFLTLRAGMMGHIVPRGPVTIGIKHAGSDKIVYQQLIWNYTPEKITNGLKGNLKDPVELTKKKDPRNAQIFQCQMISPLFDVMQQVVENKNDSKDIIGARESYVPALGKIWWSTDSSNPFHAYLYETDDRKLIGYVRIPHYKGWFGAFEEFEKIIAFFQERSDALVIDQINNPGGNPLYCYSLLSTLTDQPLATPKDRITITQENVSDALFFSSLLEGIEDDEQARELFGDSFFGQPVSYQMVQFFLEYLNFIVSEWDAGRHFTQPHYLYSLDHINAHPSTKYTKPILFLINEGDISCGDYAPAILQDNKRATLMGTRTAGAGGYLLIDQFPNRYGINLFSYTGSISERINKNPIENLGVTPDIHYELTEDDLRYGFNDYAKAINAAVKNLLNPQPKTESVIEKLTQPHEEIEMSQTISEDA